MAFLINQVDAVVTLANKIKDNGKLGSYNIRERTKVNFFFINNLFYLFFLIRLNSICVDVMDLLVFQSY